MTAKQHPLSREDALARFGHLRARAARKFFRPGLDRADLEQVAAIGLIKACDRYDARLRTPFEAFAWLFIVGELMHYVRDHERMVRPPRGLRRLERRAQEVSETLTRELGREPSTGEVAARMGATRREADDIARYREQAIPQSLDSLEPHQLNPCSYTIEDRDDRMILDAALDRLTRPERTIVLALYAGGYSQIEIADRLGYSRRHISRLHRTALKKMRPAWVPRSA